jgi:hypothetical protein
MLTPNQEAWLQALEGDEFKQTKGVLQRGDNFCCLGVGCVVAERAGVPVTRTNLGKLIGANLVSQAAVCVWLGLKHVIGASIDPGRKTLVKLNDSGVSFKEIAQIIRENPEQYFV